MSYGIGVNAARIIERRARTHIVTRRPSGSFADGLPRSASPLAPIEIRAFFAPAGGRDLLRLEEGRRAQETKQGFTTTQLFAGGQNATYEADLVEIDGELWEVQHAEPWPAKTDFFRVLVQRPR